MKGDIQIKNTKTLSNEKYKLEKISFSYQDKDGREQQKTNEVYDIGNAVSALLYNPEKNSVILTRQLRLVAFLSQVQEGRLVEACAGKLEDEAPEAGMKREIEEETGYTVQKLEQVCEVFTTPGAVKEMLYLFIAEYSEAMKTGKGGGLQSEQEEIEIIETSLEQAFGMIADGRIKDAKTIILLQHLKLQQLMKR